MGPDRSDSERGRFGFATSTSGVINRILARLHLETTRDTFRGTADDDEFAMTSPALISHHDSKDVV